MDTPLRKGELFAVISVLMFAITTCGPVHKSVGPTTESMNEIQSLAIIVPSAPNFTVIYERAKATNAPAVFFGLIGAAIASGHNESLDNKKANLLSPYLDSFSCRSIFLQSLQDILNETHRFTEIKVFDRSLEAKDVLQDVTVIFHIANWGIRLVDREKDHMRAFVELHVKMIRTEDGKVLWDDREVVMGQRCRALKSYQEDKKLLPNDLKEACSDAGSRIASMLIYH